jgi:hypothetical protein
MNKWLRFGEMRQTGGLGHRNVQSGEKDTERSSKKRERGREIKRGQKDKKNL